MIWKEDRIAVQLFTISTPGMMDRWRIGMLVKGFGRDNTSLFGLFVKNLKGEKLMVEVNGDGAKLTLNYQGISTARHGGGPLLC